MVYGIKTHDCPPLIKDLVPFEKEMFEMVKTIKFRTCNSNFQKQLKKDIRIINTTDTTLTFADKTSNLYTLPKENYNKLHNNAVTSTYKKVNMNIHHRINSEGKKIMKNQEISNRLLINGNEEAFITLKDQTFKTNRASQSSEK